MPFCYIKNFIHLKLLFKRKKNKNKWKIYIEQWFLLFRKIKLFNWSQEFNKESNGIKIFKQASLCNKNQKIKFNFYVNKRIKKNLSSLNLLLFSNIYSFVNLEEQMISLRIKWNYVGSFLSIILIFKLLYIRMMIKTKKIQ